MIIAYLRVSTEKQQVENQKHEISKFARNKKIVVDRWEGEVVSGTKDESERVLGKILNDLKKNDTLIVAELSRLSRSILGIMQVINKCNESGVILYSVKENYESNCGITSQIISFAFGLVAEVERDLISMRTKEALDRLKSMGIKLGRPAGTDSKLQVLRKRKKEVLEMREMKFTQNQIAANFKVSRTTLINFFKQEIQN